MENSTPIPHTVAEWVLLFLAALLGYGANQIPSLFRRKQTKADIENTAADTRTRDADTRKRDAETRNLELQTNLQAGDIVLGMVKELAAATLQAERLRAERDHWQRKAEAEGIARQMIEKQLDPIISLGRRMEEDNGE